MGTEWTVTIGFICAVVGLVAGIVGMKRNYRMDASKDASAMTTVAVKLENLSFSLSEIKAEIKTELRSAREDQREDRERIIKLESWAKSMQEQLNQQKGK